MDNHSTEIIEYQPDHQPWFEDLNRKWIEQYFSLEPVDLNVLQEPEKYILSKGGRIMMASHRGEVVGTAAIRFVEPGIYEFTKMAVDERYRGRYIGKALTVAAIDKAKELGAKKVILYSNTILAPAISLYRKLGFEEVPVDGPYKRSNIKMELRLDQTGATVLRKATIEDTAAIVQIGMQTFYDTFAAINKKEDMDIYLAKNFNTRQVESELSDPCNTFILAEVDGIPVGYAKLRKSETPRELKGAHSIEIERVYAAKDYIGKKVGHKLIDAMLNIARQEEYDAIWLGVWEHNERAIAFYKKQGFEKFGSHPFMLGNDLQTDHLMKKDLA